jgi:hypothetical protein
VFPYRAISRFFQKSFYTAVRPSFTSSDSHGGSAQALCENGAAKLDHEVAVEGALIAPGN